MDVKYDKERDLQSYYDNTLNYFDKADWMSGKGLVNASMTGVELLSLFRSVDVTIDRSTILDFGCGIGLTSVYLTTNFNCDCFGIDYSLERIKIAEQNKTQSCEFVTGDVNHWLDESDRLFDVILAFEIIEHLTHPEDVIVKLKKHLVPGGILIGSLPYQDTPGGPHLSAFKDKSDIETRLNVTVLDNVINMRFENQNVFIWRNL